LDVDETDFLSPFFQVLARTAIATNDRSFNGAKDGMSPWERVEVRRKGAIVASERKVVVLKLGPASRCEIPYIVSEYPNESLLRPMSVLVYSPNKLRPIGNGGSHVPREDEVKLEVICPFALHIVDFEFHVRRYPDLY
jgi:hypothetical protein